MGTTAPTCAVDSRQCERLHTLSVGSPLLHSHSPQTPNQRQHHSFSIYKTAVTPNPGINLFSASYHPPLVGNNFASAWATIKLKTRVLMKMLKTTKSNEKQWFFINA